MRWLIALFLVLLPSAQATAQTLTLEWDPNTDITAVAHRVYANAALVGEVGAAQTRVALNVQYDTDYEFWVTAVNIMGMEGARSTSAFGRVSMPMQPSPDGTKATAIVDCKPSRWTLGAGGATMRDGVHAAGGYVTVYKLVACEVWGEASGWWRFRDATGWTFMQAHEPGTPEPSPEPPTSPSDTTKPIVTLSLAHGGGKSKTSWTYTASATDNVSVAWLLIQVDGQSLPLCSSFTNCVGTVTLTKGSHTFVARAADFAGNVAEVTRVITVK